MKQQYFGDISDYVKYGLLRALVRTDLRLFVSWMLTAADSRPDGRHIDYLKQPARYRQYDAPLFDELRSAVTSGRRSVAVVTERQLVPRSTCQDALLADSAVSRAAYFDELAASAPTADLIFFDPDNGFEVPSVRAGRRGSSKYVYWAEVEQVVAAGASVLIYQHFPRRERAAYLDELLSTARRRLESRAIAIRSPRVAFVLVGSAAHAESLEGRAAAFAAAWTPLVSLHR